MTKVGSIQKQRYGKEATYNRLRLWKPKSLQGYDKINKKYAPNII